MSADQRWHDGDLFHTDPVGTGRGAPPTNPGDVRIALEGDVDLERRDEVRAALRAAADAGSGDVVVDLSGVTFLDSSGLAAIADLVHHFEGSPRRVVLEHPTPTVRRTLEIVGFQEMTELR